jgi:hypothetical protein
MAKRKKHFEIKSDQHTERIEEYRERMENCVDLFTGKPLEGEDLEGWKVAMNHRQQYENSPAVQRRVRVNI